jgi:L,D-transpeptidase YcbB
MRSSLRTATASFWAASLCALLTCSAAGAAEPNGPEALIGPKDGVLIAIKNRLSEKSDQSALLQYYGNPESRLLWVDEKGLGDRARSVMEEIGKADEYGLRASDYSLPKPDPSAGEGGNAEDSSASEGGSAEALAEAEIKLSSAVLRYARDARGGRLDPQALTKSLDPTLALPDPVQLLSSMAIRSDPAVYLRSFQPSHPQFEALRKALAEARGGGAAAPVKEDTVQIPDGPVLRLGIENDQVALLRKRLKVASGPRNTRFDAEVDAAVRQFQSSRGVLPDGIVGPGTRRLLNQGQRQQSRPVREKQILVNMERWRWLPNDLGPFYVAANIPEFTLRVMDEEKPVFTTRIVVGKTVTPTPIFREEMETVVFGPFWNVPNSIKMEELLPSIRGGGGGDWFFGGGYWDTSVFQRNGLRVAIGTREIDPSRLDWSRIDIRSLNVYQPPGGSNVLGNVKFLFPNEHDVYMHDTSQKHLFAKPVRAESHGCMRVQNPEQFAQTLLRKDQGWSANQVSEAFHNSHDRQVQLREKVPVYINYFTLRVNDDGSIATFPDIYGHDGRIAAALFGGAIPFDTPAYEEAEYQVPMQPRRASARRGGRGAPSFADVFSDF